MDTSYIFYFRAIFLICTFAIALVFILVTPVMYRRLKSEKREFLVSFKLLFSTALFLVLTVVFEIVYVYFHLYVIHILANITAVCCALSIFIYSSHVCVTSILEEMDKYE